MKIKQTTVAYILLTSAILSLSVAPYAYADCAGVTTSLINCSGSDGIMGILKLIIKIMTGCVGIAAIGGVVYGAILYSSAGGNVEQAKNARTIILNVVIGIIVFAFAFAFLNWLIPGGVFK